MMRFTSFFDTYGNQLIATAVTIVVFVVIRLIINSIIAKFTEKSNFSQARSNLVKRYVDYLIWLLVLIILVSIWGIKREQLFLFLSSVLTVIGVAFFAQWSILSNITAGIIVFFSFPFRIGDQIKIMDKDYPIEAEIIDIKSFYTLLKTIEGEEILLPNNLLLQKGIVIVTK
ncbi:mechanosensitive ion channel family protein [Capnocytophaga sp.]|uniref:mechanosensitive ion channel domain-containing protein n=1 Tax=Capnocytophaga sp. TaxID=44737 RepID=UPI0026DD7F0B|nr:mechanosensitive ion channel family protein [Capnocytophaga sp.]MDO5104358.1 mechanosensitive ion channel family protein [Capnocytophaga sp.]